MSSNIFISTKNLIQHKNGVCFSVTPHRT